MSLTFFYFTFLYLDVLFGFIMSSLFSPIFVFVRLLLRQWRSPIFWDQISHFLNRKQQQNNRRKNRIWTDTENRKPETDWNRTDKKPMCLVFDWLETDGFGWCSVLAQNRAEPTRAQPYFL